MQLACLNVPQRVTLKSSWARRPPSSLLNPPAVWGNWDHIACRGPRVTYTKEQVPGTGVINHVHITDYQARPHRGGRHERSRVGVRCQWRGPPARACDSCLAGPSPVLTPFVRMPGPFAGGGQRAHR